MNFSKTIGLFVIVIATDLTNAHQCYVCSGCKTVKASDLQTCPTRTELTTSNAEIVVTTIQAAKDVTESVNAATNAVTELATTNNPAGVTSSPAATTVKAAVTTSDATSGTSAVTSIASTTTAIEEGMCSAVVYEENGALTVLRGCYYEAGTENKPTDNESCRDMVGKDDKILACIICEGELCNSSARNIAALTLMGFSLITFLL